MENIQNYKKYINDKNNSGLAVAEAKADDEPDSDKDKKILIDLERRMEIE